MNNIRPIKTPPNAAEQKPATSLAEMLGNLCGAVKGALPNVASVEAQYTDRLCLLIDFRDKNDFDTAAVMIRSGLIPMFKDAKVETGTRPAGKLIYRLVVEVRV